MSDHPSRPIASSPAAGIAAVLVLFTVHFLHWELICDDAYISFRYARNLAEGHGLVYNVGDAVEGYSNFLWVLLLAAMARVGLALETAAVVLGYVFALVTLGLVFVWTRIRLGLSPWSSVFAVAALAATSPWVFWASAGLETSLFTALLTGFALAFVSDALERRSVQLTLGTLGALLAMTRPEGIGILPAALVALVAVRRYPLDRVVVTAAPFALLVGAHMMWRRAYYGAWLPLTAEAKSGLSVRGVQRGVEYLVDGIVLEHLWVLLLLAIVGLVPTRRTSADAAHSRTAWLDRLVLGGIVGTYFLFIVLVGGDALYKNRLIGFMAPMIAVLAALGLDALARRQTRTAPAVAAITLAMTALATFRPQFEPPFSLEFVRGFEQRWSTLGRFLHEHAPSDAVLALVSAGRPPYESNLVTIDLLGLNDRTIARTPLTDAGKGRAGHERANPSYVLERRPDIIFLSPRVDRLELDGIQNLEYVADLLAVGPIFRYIPLLEAPEFIAHYRPVVVEHDGESYSFFVRRGSGAETFPPGKATYGDWTSQTAPTGGD